MTERTREIGVRAALGASRGDILVALLLGVSGIACWVPAWRAARVDPSITLKAE